MCLISLCYGSFLHCLEQENPLPWNRDVTFYFSWLFIKISPFNGQICFSAGVQHEILTCYCSRASANRSVSWDLFWRWVYKTGSAIFLTRYFVKSPSQQATFSILLGELESIDRLFCFSGFVACDNLLPNEIGRLPENFSASHHFSQAFVLHKTQNVVWKRWSKPFCFKRERYFFFSFT